MRTFRRGLSSTLRANQASSFAQYNVRLGGGRGLRHLPIESFAFLDTEHPAFRAAPAHLLFLSALVIL